MSICFDDSKNARENDLYLLALTGHYAGAICQGRSLLCRVSLLLSGWTDLTMCRPTRGPSVRLRGLGLFIYVIFTPL